MVPIIGFYGASNSGKTTLLCKVIGILVAQGLKIGTIKHHGHDTDLQRTGQIKDSDRLLDAGSEKVALVHGRGLRFDEASHPPETDPRVLAQRLMGGMDLVLVEGFKKAELDKIEVVGPGRSPILAKGGRILALVTRCPEELPHELPVLDANNPGQVADFLMAHFHINERRPADNSIRLYIGEDEVPLTRRQREYLEARVDGLLLLVEKPASLGSIEVKIA